MPLPTEEMRTNRGTWVVPVERMPAVGRLFCELLPTEPFDPAFEGQRLVTTYLDTSKLVLRRARCGRDRYLTLRVRCYRPRGGGAETYALSAKTEDQKFRVAISSGAADAILAGSFDALVQLLPADLLARLLELAGTAPVQPVAMVSSLRYAVEDEQERLTLDCGIHTDTSKRLEPGVLEFKSMQPVPSPPLLLALGLSPIKLSKFLWSTKI